MKYFFVESLVDGNSGEGRKSNDFFDDPEEKKNLQTKNLIAVSITGFILVVIFVIAFIVYQYCKW